MRHCCFGTGFNRGVVCLGSGVGMTYPITITISDLLASSVCRTPSEILYPSETLYPCGGIGSVDVATTTEYDIAIAYSHEYGIKLTSSGGGT